MFILQCKQTGFSGAGGAQFLCRFLRAASFGRSRCGGGLPVTPSGVRLSGWNGWTPRPRLSRRRYIRRRSVSADLAVDEISATGGRLRLALRRDISFAPGFVSWRCGGSDMGKDGGDSSAFVMPVRLPFGMPPGFGRSALASVRRIRRWR